MEPSLLKQTNNLWCMYQSYWFPFVQNGNKSTKQRFPCKSYQHRRISSNTLKFSHIFWIEDLLFKIKEITRNEAFCAINWVQNPNIISRLLLTPPTILLAITTPKHCPHQETPFPPQPKLNNTQEKRRLTNLTQHAKENSPIWSKPWTPPLPYRQSSPGLRRTIRLQRTTKTGEKENEK